MRLATSSKNPSDGMKPGQIGDIDKKGGTGTQRRAYYNADFYASNDGDEAQREGTSKERRADVELCARRIPISLEGGGDVIGEAAADGGGRCQHHEDARISHRPCEKDLPAGLLDCFRAGERWAFEAVYQRYVTLVSRVIGAALRRSEGARVSRRKKRGRRDPGDLPDLVQEVFARVFSSAARQRFEGQDLKPYLMGIATYVVMEFGRARKKYVFADIDWIADRIAARHADVEGNATSMASAIEQRRSWWRPTSADSTRACVPSTT